MNSMPRSSAKASAPARARETRNLVEPHDRPRPVFQACRGSRALDGTQSNEPNSPVANDRHKPSINEPGTKMNANAATVSLLAKFMLQQIAQKSAQTARFLLRSRERTGRRTGRRTVISAVRRHQRNSTAAELAEMNMTERNKTCKANAKHASRAIAFRLT
jgi:hypothetical protein